MCAHAVRVAVEKLPGVERAEVSLEDGVAVITFDSTNELTLDDVRRIVRENGFTPRGAEVRISGQLIERGGRLELLVPGQQRPLTLRPDTSATGLIAELRRTGVNREVTIDAFAPEPPRSADRVSTLHVRSYRFSR